MTTVARTPLRAIRVPDDIWEAAQARAKDEGTSVSAVVVATLRHYGSVPFRPDPAERAAIAAELDAAFPLD